jgi:transposase
VSHDDSLPNDVETLKSMLVAERAARMAAEGEAQHRALLIDKLKYTIRKLRHERFGQSSERGTLLDQLELQLADLEEDAAQAEAAAGMAAASHKIAVWPFERRKPARRPLPEHLPRERIVYPLPATCPCCGGGALRKIGEDVTETLELIPRQWKVIQHVREKLSCRTCEAITQPPAPSHPIARGRAGPKLLAHVLFSKYGLHLPLARQSAVYVREGKRASTSLRIDIVELGGGDQRVDGGCAPAAFVGAREGPVAAPNRDRTQLGSAALFDIHSRPSSRKRVNAGQRLRL